MIRAIIFDCYGVLLVDTSRGRARNEPLLEAIAGLRPQYRTALLSNTERTNVSGYFTAAELTTLFDVVHVSGDTGYVKHDTRAYAYAAAELMVQPTECIMVDDAATNCQAAQAIGMYAVQYQSLKQMQAAIAACIRHAAG
jgi:HAD superfamily hydrolase (TIGR01509 family)